MSCLRGGQAADFRMDRVFSMHKEPNSMAAQQPAAEAADQPAADEGETLICASSPIPPGYVITAGKFFAGQCGDAYYIRPPDEGLTVVDFSPIPAGWVKKAGPFGYIRSSSGYGIKIGLP